jgi:hypothetical protein
MIRLSKQKAHVHRLEDALFKQGRVIDQLRIERNAAKAALSGCEMLLGMQIQTLKADLKNVGARAEKWLRQRNQALTRAEAAEEKLKTLQAQSNTNNHENHQNKTLSR